MPIDFSSPDIQAKDPLTQFQESFREMRSRAQAFAVATVIDTIGSASARVGSKAIFDGLGKNQSGWVGGGCAERFVGENVLISIKERRSQIITADMDDSIFGLGMVCGGKMQIFIEPFFPAELVRMRKPRPFDKEALELASLYGWQLEWIGEETLSDVTALFTRLSSSLAESRGLSNQSLRTLKDLPVKWLAENSTSPNGPSRKGSLRASSPVLLLGRSRIVEALARHFTLLGTSVRVYGLNLDLKQYPETASCTPIVNSYDEVVFLGDEIVIVATHTAQDPQLVERALQNNSFYVGMVGSRVRALELFASLNFPEGHEIQDPLYIPAGLDIGAAHPEEIALSILAEVYGELS